MNLTNMVVEVPHECKYAYRYAILSYLLARKAFRVEVSLYIQV